MTHRPRKRIIAFWFATIILVLGTSETPPAGPPGSTAVHEIESLIRMASTSKSTEYVAFRTVFLQHDEARQIHNIRITIDTPIRFCVVADAWKRWLIEPETALSLWDYSPPDNQMCNPHPAMHAQLLQRLESAGDAGIRIARERLLFRPNRSVSAIASLLKSEGSAASIEVLIEAMFSEDSIHVEFADADEFILARLLEGFDRAGIKSRNNLIWTFAWNRYRPAATRIGSILESFEKNDRSMYHNTRQYDSHVRAVGDRYVMYFEYISRETFHKSEVDQTSRAIDRTKAWWLKHKHEFHDAGPPLRQADGMAGDKK